MKQRSLPFLFILSLLFFQACKKDRDETPKEKETTGVYVLFQGSWGDNESGIAWYNIKTGQSDPDYFKTVNGYNLGESANDLQQYGNKIYCVVSGTQGKKESFLEVIDPATGKSLSRISFNGATEGYMPRYSTFYKNKAYVSAYDGKIRRIDTASLAIDGEVLAGGALEGITAANNKLYVTNSVHPLFPDVTQNVVSVVDINTFQKVKEISVSTNPTKIAAAGSGNMIVVSDGDYGAVAPAHQIISSSSDAVTATFNAGITYFSIAGDYGYAITDAYTNPAIKSLNTSTAVLGSNFITEGTGISYPLGITENPLNGDAVISNTQYNADQTVTYSASYFAADGKLKFKFTTGANPAQAVFVYSYK